MTLWSPERYFSRITDIDIERDLLAPGYTHVLLDIDNTIRARDTHAVPRDVGMWLGRARTAGVQFCLVSNNWHADAHDFAAQMELPLVAKAMKPLPPAFFAGMRKLGARRSDTVVIGDQLTTDVLGAHCAGLPAYMLQPLVKQDLKHTKVLRVLESAILGDRQPEPAVNATADAGVPGSEGVPGRPAGAVVRTQPATAHEE